VWHYLAALLPFSLFSIAEDQRLIEPTTACGETRPRSDEMPAKFSALFSRDDPRSSTLQLKAEIGPTQPLYSPEHILRDLNLWSDVFSHAMRHYLNQEEREHLLPTLPYSPSHLKTPLLVPTNIEYEDSRLVLLDGNHLDRIDRRQVYFLIDYKDVDPDASDYQLVESGLYYLSHYMREQLIIWYNRSQHPIRHGYSVGELVDAKGREKQRLFG